MPLPTAADWKAWNEERQSYLGYASQGFDSDIEALETHIRKLQEVAPKDKADWPNSRALSVIDHLKEDLKAARVWQGLMHQED